MAGYHSALRAETYDLDVARTPWLNDDIPIYLDACKQMRSLREPASAAEDEYLVLDVGTGTGRVFQHLAEDMVRENVTPDQTHFIGVDLSPHMINRAKATVPKSLASRITYTVGSALDLQAIVPRPPKVDLLMFAYGSISLLTEPGAAEQFLRQAAAVLRPVTGRAYVSIGYLFDDSRDVEAKRIFDRYAQLPARTDTPSADEPNVVYRYPAEYMSEKREGNIVKVYIPMQVIEKGPDGKERLVKQDNSTMRCRIWGVGEFLLAAAAAGLQLVGTRQTFNETSYAFCVSSN